jgi:hypothetical protein
MTASAWVLIPSNSPRTFGAVPTGRRTRGRTTSFDPTTPMSRSSHRAVRLRLAHDGSEILRGFIQVWQWEYLIAFERPPVDHFFLSAGLSFRRVGFLLAVPNWPPSRGLSQDTQRLMRSARRPRVRRRPSTARAAAKQNRIVRRSLNVTRRTRLGTWRRLCAMRR